jgi:hypothetical protein
MPTNIVISPTDIATALKNVRDQKTFLNDLLAETLNWPVSAGVTTTSEITYEWSEDELRARDLNQKLVEGSIHQLKLSGDQTWGIFILEFKRQDVFTADRGMTGTLRKVLRGLVKCRNKPSTQPAWPQENLLFICTHKYEHFRIAHFKAPKEDGRTARLAAFGWGPDIPARTACEFNLNHLGWPDAVDGFDHWTEAFNVEKVTKKFYREYSDEFDALRKAVKGLGSDTEDQKMFTQTLLNRLMFLRFIERKGWLTPPGDSTGRDYLRLLFEAGNYRGKSFYIGRVRKLFFEGLAVEGKQESESIGKVPFLNGGLFEENSLDEKVDDIPNEAFEPLLGPEGLFYRYNFTVQESTPLDVEVAVDPEMLGKVFEELVTGRHESGSYYTPRPVVSFMCREALKGYLSDVAKLPEKTVTAFVDKHDTSRIDISGAQALVTALNNLKAVDPACGSGAYLLGLLHEMVDLYRLLYSEKLNHSDDKLHDLKLRIISNSIYGVDIDKFATNIAMLRLWLSLSVDSKKPLPLPNLEFKIETGDSLSGPDPSQIKDFWQLLLQDHARKLIRKKEAYLKCHDSSKKAKLQEVMDDQEYLAKAIQAQLGEGVIDWRIHFAEVFAGEPAESTMEGFFPQLNKTPKAQMSFTVGEKRGGFDIVLANPPYVRQESIVALKPQLKEVFPKVYSGTADLYTYFYARALQCLRPGGMLAFISSNKWFRAGYGKKLRTHIANTASVKTILDFHDLPVFESAIAYPMIFIAVNRPRRADDVSILAEPPTLDAPYPHIGEVVGRYGHQLPTVAFGLDGSWHLATTEIADKLAKMRSGGTKLIDFVEDRIYYGIKTGLNEVWEDSRGKVYTKGDKRPAEAERHGVFIIDGPTRQRLIDQDPKSAEIIRPMAAGKDVARWVVTSRDAWLIFTRRGIDIDRYPAIKQYLSRWKRELTPKKQGEKRDRPGRKPGTYKWYEIQDEIAYYHEFEKPRIVYQEIATYQAFALIPAGVLVNNKVFMICSADLYLLSILNSRPAWQFLHEIAAKMVAGAFAMQLPYVSQIPIPSASTADRKTIGALAEKCLAAKGIGCESWEREIDERVAALYGL